MIDDNSSSEETDRIDILPDLVDLLELIFRDPAVRDGQAWVSFDQVYFPTRYF